MTCQTFLVFGLAALALAQNATIWHWFAYGENNAAQPSDPISSSSNHRAGTVRVLEDTVYVMGIYIGNGAGAADLPLPRVRGDVAASVPAANAFSTQTYLAAYNRRTGQILWWVSFRPSNVERYLIEGLDFVVTPEGRLYLLLDANIGVIIWRYQRPNDCCPTENSLTISTEPSGSNRFNTIVEITPGATPSVQKRRTIAVADSRGWARLKYLYYASNTLYVTGEYMIRQPGPWSLEDDEGTIFCYAPPGGPCPNTSGSQIWRGLIIAYSTSPTWRRLRAAEVRYETAAGIGEEVLGHRLAQDPMSGQLRWMVEVQQTATRNLYYNPNSGPETRVTITPGPLSMPVHTLYVLSLRPDLMTVGQNYYHQIAQRSGGRLESTPPHLMAQGDSLLWVHPVDYDLAVMDRNTHTIINASFNNPAIVVVRQRLPLSQNNAELLASQGIGGFSSFAMPQVSDIGVERGWELLYLMGSAQGTIGPEGLPLGRHQSVRSGFVLGLRYAGSTYRVLGWHPLRSAASQRMPAYVLIDAGYYDPVRAQFYLLGSGQDSVEVNRCWPDGRNDTVRIRDKADVFFGLWLGRLDWYRITGTPQTIAACVPDTVAPNVSLIEWGTYAANPPEAPKESLYVWLPLNNPYHPYQRAAYLRATQHVSYSSLREISAYYSLRLWVEGRLPTGSSYILTRPVWGRNHFTGDLWADVIDTIRLTVSGTTIPAGGRTTATASTFMVVPYAGSKAPGAPDITAPYPRYRRENWKFPLVSRLYYHPHYYAPPDFTGTEMLLAITTNPSFPVWGIDLKTGLVHALPRANSIPGGSERYFIDPVRGTYWAAVERSLGIASYMTILRAPFQSEVDELIQQGNELVSSVRDAYPLSHEAAWIQDIHGAAVLPGGDIVFVASTYPAWPFSYATSLWRVSFERDSVYRVTGRAYSNTCPADGTGSRAMLRPPITDLAVNGDTLYWIEPHPAPCASGARDWYLLRRAYPQGSLTTYTIQTLDTIVSIDSPWSYLLFTPLPVPALLFGTSAFPDLLIRYTLSTRQRDTLIGCNDPGSCCAYGLSDWILEVWNAALLRGGTIAISDPTSTIRLAVPIAPASQEDTLQMEEGISRVTSVAGTPVTPAFSGATLHFGWPVAGGPGMDSTYLAVNLSGCGRGKPFYYPFYHLPQFRFQLRAPGSVCVGQVFHSYILREGDELIEGGCPSHFLMRKATSAREAIAELAQVEEVQRLRAIQAGYDTLVSAVAAPKWRYLVSDSLLLAPVRVRQGHRLRIQVALEGPYDPGTFLHRPHGFLTRYNLGAYNQRILPVSTDSLWRLPYIPGDSLLKTWDGAMIDPWSSCPGAGIWYCEMPWTGLARVELRESPDGPVVDSGYALIDTAGRLYMYAAPLASIRRGFTGSADTLHFCQCDPATPKYITVRFPNHLPLHTPAISLPARGLGEVDTLNLQDPTYLEGIPGEHYTFVPGPGGTARAAAWAGNCADLHNSFVPGGAHVDAGQINAADYDFVITRNGITLEGFSIADLNGDGSVDALDAVIVIENQNRLRQSSRP